jgi:hypothetical protein
VAATKFPRQQTLRFDYYSTKKGLCQELDGVLDDSISCYALRGKSDNDKLLAEAQVWIQMKSPDTIPVRKFACNPKTLRKVELAERNRCPENIPLRTKVFALR